MSDNQSFTNPTLKVVFNQGSTIPSNDKKAGKRKDGLRKGKWTVSLVNIPILDHVLMFISMFF